jgi:hypothetical protein
VTAEEGEEDEDTVRKGQSRERERNEERGRQRGRGKRRRGGERKDEEGGREEGGTKSPHAVTRNSLQKLQQPLPKCRLRERLARINLFARKAAVRVQRQSDISDVSVMLAEGDSAEGEGERTTEGIRV